MGIKQVRNSRGDETGRDRQITFKLTDRRPSILLVINGSQLLLVDQVGIIDTNKSDYYLSYVILAGVK